VSHYAQEKNGENLLSIEGGVSKLDVVNKTGDTSSLKSSPIDTLAKVSITDKGIGKRSRHTHKLPEASTKSSVTQKTKNGEKSSLTEGIPPKSVVVDKSCKSLSLRSLPNDDSFKSLVANRGTIKRSRHTPKLPETNPESPIMQKTKTGETLYFAEGVLGERTNNGCREYRIKWKGYSKREAT